jgi:hypothetical protein
MEGDRGCVALPRFAGLHKLNCQAQDGIPQSPTYRGLSLASSNGLEKVGIRTDLQRVLDMHGWT